MFRPRSTRTNRRSLFRPRLNQLEDRTAPAGWPLGIGSPAAEWGNDVAVDAAGNVFATGTFESTVDFDPETGTANMTSAGIRDIFLVKFNAGGTFLWSRRVGGAWDESSFGGTTVAVDQAGNVYITGVYRGSGGSIAGVDGTTPLRTGMTSSFTTQANGNKTTYYQDGLVAKFGPDGSLAWVGLFGGGGATTAAHNVAVQPDGSAVYVTGQFSGTGAVDFDPGPGTALRPSPNQPSNNLFVVKLDSGGAYRWASTAGGAGDDIGDSVAVAADGSAAYVVGNFTATASFGPAIALTSSNGSSDPFVAKLDAGSGSFVWAHRMGGTGSDRGRGIAAYRSVDPVTNATTDEVYITGDFVSPTADFGPVRLTHNGNPTHHNGFVSKLEDTGAAGNFLWTRQFAPATLATVGGLVEYDLVVDALGGVYTTGQFSGSLDFDLENTTPNDTLTSNLVTGGHPRSTSYAPEVFVAKLDAEGNFKWARRMGAPTGESGGSIGFGIAWDAISGAVFVTGWYINGRLDTGTAILTNRGSHDAYVAKLAPGSPVLAAGGPAVGSTRSRLTHIQLQPILAAAIDRWATAGLDAAGLAVMRRATVAIADLGGSYLGLADPATHAIRIDDDAAGHGWFVDATPFDDSEFRTRGNQGEQRRMDLLSAVAHELGHLVGLDHDAHDGNVMGDSLATGVRRTPTVADFEPPMANRHPSVWRPARRR